MRISAFRRPPRGAVRGTVATLAALVMVPSAAAVAAPSSWGATAHLDEVRSRVEQRGISVIGEITQARAEAVLPGGSPRRARVASLLSGKAAAAESALVNAYAAYRDAVAAPNAGLRGETFAQVTSRVQPLSVQWQGDTATVRVREFVTAQVAGAPVPWEFAVPQRYQLQAQGDEVRVTEVAFDAEPELVREDDLAALRTQLSIAPRPDGPAGMTLESRDLPSTPVNGGRPDADEKRSSIIFGGRTAHVLSDNEYDHRAAATYATKYALQYNPAYRYWEDNDCTNFVSQSLWEGGWELEGDEVQNHEHWWYYKEPREQSGSWIYAPALVNFLRTEKRATVRRGLNFMALGDVANLVKKEKNTVSHAMVVTTSEDGYPYFSYHSVDNRNRSLKSLIERAPQKDFSYIGWRVRTKQ